MKGWISKEVQFDAGHRVPDHASKCRNPHGHRYRVVVTVFGTVQAETGRSDTGMVIDFGHLKRLLTDHVHDRFDHGFIVHAEDQAMRKALAVGALEDGTDWKVLIVPFVPTAENLAIEIFDTIDKLASARLNFRVAKVDVWETPTSCATIERTFVGKGTDD